jgi:transposase
MHHLEELVRLHRMGTKSREVARLLQISPNTERQYRLALASENVLLGPVEQLPELGVLKAAIRKHYPPKELPKQQLTSLGAYRDPIELLQKKGLGARAIYDRLRLEHAPFPGTYSSVKRLCRTLCKARGVRPQDVAIPVETAPAEVAQVDFGYVGKLLDPVTMTLRKAWCFVMVLGYSRHMVVRVVFDQKVETWLRLHVEAFTELGGVVETVVPDNLKAAVIRAAFAIDGTTELNRSYRELAKHYGIKIDPTPPYDPAKKGKVEAGVKYVKNNFFAGRENTNIDELRPELRRWVYEIAGTRVHGTTSKRPLDEFEQIEKLALRALPAIGYETIVWRKARVHRDSHVAFERRLYSAPWRLIGQEVWLCASARSLLIYADDVRVATHARRGSGLRSTLDVHLPDHRSELRHRSREYWEKRAIAMGEEVGRFIREVFDADDVLSQLRAVQAIVTHLETYPPERARAACERARLYGNYSYIGLKRILRQALDLQPLPGIVIAQSPASNDMPRFARPAASWLQRLKEVNCEPC